MNISCQRISNKTTKGGDWLQGGTTFLNGGPRKKLHPKPDGAIKEGIERGMIP